MMNKEFVPYEIALELKELGFNNDCLGWYLPEIVNKSNKASIILGSYSTNWSKFKDRISVPLYHQAFKFFREKYGLQSYINPELPFNYDEPKYTVIFVKTTKRFTTYKDNTIWVKEGVERRRFSTHEEAELECLKKLIELCKKN